jgi:hypothetical protein
LTMGSLISDGTTLKPNCTSNCRGHTGLRGSAQVTLTTKKATATKRDVRMSGQVSGNEEAVETASSEGYCAFPLADTQKESEKAAN